MDKIRPFLNFLVKHKFWLSCGLMALVLVGAWFLASNALWKTQDQNTRTLDAKIAELERVLTTKAEGLDTVNAHPNEGSQKGMESKIGEARESLLKAWQMRREAQMEIMKWPDSVLKSPEFVKFFATFDPPEAYDKIPQQHVEQYLNVYTNQIPNRMKDICAIINTTWASDKVSKQAGTSAGNARPGNGTPTAAMSTESSDSKDVVKWNLANQAIWYLKLTDFQGYDGNEQQFATAYQAFALQQDLWLLEAMFHVIKDVNGDADANDLAVIREIDHIAFGREARTQLGSVETPDPRLVDESGLAATTSSGSTSSPGSSGIPSEDNAKGNSFNFGSAPPAASGLAGAATPFEKNPPSDMINLGPFHGRYVNVNFEPLSIKEVHDALKRNSQGLPAQNLELVVAKRVPVRIALKMVETKIPDFIAACANSPFCFEISQVRIGRHKANDGIELNGGARTKGGGSGGSQDRDTPTAGMGGGGGDGGSGLDGGGDASGSSSAPGSGPVEVERRTNLIVDVEFYGIVKIYNPVNPDRLKTQEEVDSPPAANTAAAPGPAPKSGNP